MLDDASLVQRAPDLLAQFALSEAAVAAIPERPITSSFLAVEPATDPQTLRLDAVGLHALAVVWTIEVGLTAQSHWHPRHAEGCTIQTF